MSKLRSGVNLACRLLMNPLIFGGRHSLKPLSISRSLLLMRDVNSPSVPFGVRVVWYMATSACTSFQAPPQVRSKVIAYCSNDQIEPLTRTDLLLTELIGQASTNRSERKRLVQFDSVLEWGRAGIMSPKTELTQPRSQTAT